MHFLRRLLVYVASLGRLRPSRMKKTIQAQMYGFYDPQLLVVVDSFVRGKGGKIFVKLKCPMYGKDIVMDKAIFDFLFRGQVCSETVTRSEGSEKSVSSKQD